jgi:hypothetical protein
VWPRGFRRFRLSDFMTFGTWRWWDRQPHAPATFTPGNVPGTHFHLGLSQPQGHGTVGRNMSPKNPVTPPGIDPGIVRLVTQRLNHYATAGPCFALGRKSIYVHTVPFYCAVWVKIGITYMNVVCRCSYNFREITQSEAQTFLLRVNGIKFLHVPRKFMMFRK